MCVCVCVVKLLIRVLCGHMCMCMHTCLFPTDLSCEATPVNLYTADSTSPMLANFSTDMTLGQLTLYFTETIMRNRFNLTSLLLIDTLGTPDQSYQLQHTGTVENASVNSDTLTVTLDTRDLNIIKNFVPRLFDKLGTSFLVVAPNTILDMASNPAAGLSLLTAVQTFSFTADMKDPKLTSFNLDMNSNYLNLTFDEVVEVTSFLATAITIQSSRNMSVNFTLTGSASHTRSIDGLSLHVQLLTADANRLKQTLELGTTVNDTFLSHTAALVTDVVVPSPNSVMPRPGTNALQASDVIPDETAPEVSTFTLFDLDSGSFDILFNEPVSLDSVMASLFTIQSTETSNASSLTVNTGTASFVTLDDQRQVRIQLSKGDIFTLKSQLDSRTRYGAAMANTFLSVLPGSANDTSGVSALAVRSGSALPVIQHVPDTTGAEPVACSIDLTNGTLTVEFNDVVRQGTFSPTFIRLQNTMTGAGAADYDLVQDVNLADVPTYTIQFSLIAQFPDPTQADDLDQIKFRQLLAYDNTTTYIATTADLVLDTSGNAAEAITRSAALRCLGYRPDETPPRLTDWSLDLTNNYLTLTFSEVVNPETLNVTFLVLSGSGSSNLTITTQNVIRRPVSATREVRLILSKEEEDFLKRNPTLATHVGNSILTIAEGAIADYADRRLVSVSNRTARLYSRDTVPPVLRVFHLDMDLGLMTLSFSEVVDRSTLVPSRLTLQSMPVNSPPQSFVFRGGRVRNESVADNFLELEITIDDLNEIKVQTALAVNKTSSYLLIQSLGIYDTQTNFSANPVTPIPPTGSISVTNFTEDTTRPILAWFDLDLTAETLTLSFDESVLHSSLVVNNIQIQDSRMANESQAVYQLTLRTAMQPLGSRLRTTMDGTIMVVELGADDLNALKLNTNLAISNETTYLATVDNLLFDMNNNSLVPVDETWAQRVRLFTEDTKAPFLASYMLNLTSEELRLTFNEAVDAETFIVSNLTLNRADITDQTSAYQLTNSSELLSNDSTILIIRLGTADLNEIKRRQQLATTITNTYLAFPSMALSDMNMNLVQSQVLGANASVAADFFPDQTMPTLRSWSLNMEDRSLELVFDETMLASSLNVTLLQLNSSASAPVESWTLTDRSQVMRINDPILTIRLSVFDANEIKKLTSLAQDEASSLLSFVTGTARDMATNDLTRVSLKAAELVTPDVSGPVLQRFELDINMGILTLTYDETVNSTSLRPSSFLFYSNLTTEVVQLSGGAVLDPNQNIIRLNLTRDDLNAFKLIRELGTNNSNTVLNQTLGAVVDMPPIENDAVERSLATSNLVQDTTPPYIEWFNLDLNVGLLSMHFSEAVDVASLNTSGLAVQNGAFSADRVVRLHDANSSSVNGELVEIQIFRDELNELKRRVDLATDVDDTYLSLSSVTIRDMAGLPVTQRLNGLALQVNVYTNDSTRPSVRSYKLDMNTGRLSLSFLETVNVSSLVFSDIALQRAGNVSEADETSYYSLTGGSLVSSIPSTEVVIDIASNDLNAIKAYRIADSPFVTYLSLADSALTDMNDRFVLGFSSAEGRAISRAAYTPDTKSPRLSHFNISMHASELSLRFDETVDTVRYPFNVSSLVLQSLTAQGSSLTFQSHRLRSSVGTRASQGLNTDVVISIDNMDLNEIKRLVNLATDQDSTFLVIEERAVADTKGNLVQPISSTQAQRVSVYTPDMNQPDLQSFRLSMDGAWLELSFSETIDIYSLDATKITLQSFGNATFGVANYTLTSGTVSFTELPGPVFNITISDTDMNELRRLVGDGLVVDENSTFISYSASLLRDYANNPAMLIDSDEARPVTDFYTDMTNPQLVSYRVDLSLEWITLSFSETMRARSLNATAFALLNNFTDATGVRPLAGGMTNSSDATALVLYLTEADLNFIKQDVNFFTSAANAYLTLSRFAVADMYNNAIVPVPIAPARQVVAGGFTPDTVPPVLRDFTLDMNGMPELFLSFTETVNTTSLDPRQFTLQRSGSSVNGITLSGGRVVASMPYLSSASIILEKPDVDAIFNRTDLATSTSTTYLSYTSNAVIDMNNNNIVNRTIHQGKIAYNFTEDETPPHLVSFVLDLDGKGSLTLSFSETVNSVTLNPSTIELHSGGLLVDDRLNITGGELLTPWPALNVTFEFLKADLDELKRLEAVGTTQDNTLISFSSDLVQDMNKNSVVNVSDADIFNVASIIPDTTRPELVEFELDMNQSPALLSFIFSETVDASTFDVRQITIQSVYSRSMVAFESFMLLDGNSSGSDSTMLTVVLTHNDTNAIKVRRELAISQNTTFIALTNSTVRDMSTNMLVEVPIMTAERTVLFTNDSTRPRLWSARLDMDSEDLELIFSEAVDTREFNPQGITLVNAGLGMNITEEHTLRAGLLTTPDGTRQVHSTSTG